MSNDAWEQAPNPPDDQDLRDGGHERGRSRRSIFARIRDWFDRPSAGEDSYVSTVTNPDDRRFIPRR